MSINAPSGGLPYLMELKEKLWHTVEIDMSTLTDGENDRDWNCYFATINGEEDSEIPFWAMKPFYVMYDKLSKKQKKATLDVEFQRKVISGKNTASFRLPDADDDEE